MLVISVVACSVCAILFYLVVPARAIEEDGSCPLLALLPFTDVGEEFENFRPSSPPPPSIAFSHMSAALMAVEDFNTRNPIGVPALATDPILQNCTLRLTELRVLDTQFREPSPAIPRIMQDVMDGYRPCSIVGPYDDSVAVEASVTAFGLGIPLVSHGVTSSKIRKQPVSTVTTAINHAHAEVIINWLRSIGRTDYLGILRRGNEFGQEWSAALENAAKEVGYTQSHHEIFGIPIEGYVPQSMNFAVNELRKTGYRTVVAVLKSVSARFQYVADAAAEFGMSGAESGVVWVFAGNVDLDHLAYLANTNANATQILKGSAVIKMLDGFAFDPENDAFLRSWRERDADFVRRVNEVNPISSGEPGYHFADENYFRTVMPEPGAAFMYDAVMAVGMGGCKAQQEAKSGGGKKRKGGEDTSQDEASSVPPNRRASSSAVRAGDEDLEDMMQTAPSEGDDENLGDAMQPTLSEGDEDLGDAMQPTPSESDEDLGGAMQTTPESDKDLGNMMHPPPAEEPEDVMHPVGNIFEEAGGGEGRRTQKKKGPQQYKNNHLEGILASEFTGATGRLKWGEEEQTRKGKRSRIRETVTFGVYNFQESTDGRYEYKLTNVLQGSTVEDLWDVTRDGPFLFAGGTKNPPPLLRDVPEQNFLGYGVHVTGLTLMTVALFLAALSIAFVFCYRKTAVVKAAQPIFLDSLVFGSVLMSLGIFTLSFDESYGWNKQMLSRACICTPWLVVIGYMATYCALFTKTWRINKVMQFRRRKVKVKQVLGPFVALILAAVSVLTVWTAVDPFVWERYEIDALTGESYGRCQSNNTLAYFIPLILLMVTATLMTAVMAWKTKDIDESLSESSWIFYAIALQIQVILIGIPVVVILENASADAAYLGLVSVIWSFPMSTLLLIIGPKVLAAYRAKRGNGEISSKARGMISADRQNGNVHVSGLNLTHAPSPANPQGSAASATTRSQSNPLSSDTSSTHASFVACQQMKAGCSCHTNVKSKVTTRLVDFSIADESNEAPKAPLETVDSNKQQVEREEEQEEP